MDTVSPWVLVAALVFLILCSAFFAMAETALMAANKFRLRSLAKRGHRGAITTLWLLERTDKLLSLILIANTLVNAMATALATAIAILLFGYEESVIAIAIALLVFVLIVFAEIAPKFIGATYPETISLVASTLLKPMMAVSKPLIWFVNLFVRLFLTILRVKPADSAVQHRVSPEELRAIVLESSNFIPQKHKSILLNLFDLETVSIEDIMTPRSQIEALNLAVPVAELKAQLTTCYHNKLPVYEGEINRIIGILHVRHAVALLNEEDELSIAHFRELLTTPYFIPQDTSVFTQLQYFQENKERLGIIVDEYGEVQGLVTLDDIIEEMIGDFTTSVPGAARGDSFCWDAHGECLLEGTAPLREINKRLGLAFPLDGPKTVNGLMLEQLQEIPDAAISLKIGNVVIEVIQVKDQAIKVVKLTRPAPP
ncbi:HlyC/CorC family transporter [Massilia antarctica]|uniref:HlyC/CorC family transporter n=1 Tax=Massilia antarctica TaxID=2765360 RepID=UPI0006BB76CD|nr:HlyC/CorC family transporter [Massilia sp. H27-R4]MCY0913002.1 HlyC/CorC family transporter [Massilia sp. H27-R4]CUI07582.1 Magnesium and cobalt efflux protein CorC [Janthinobacterium sp. CG23_2]CUU31368.1 Magnesium and cobalt efflux protein CorC [Janthinobacterium sp. CG23_2]